MNIVGTPFSSSMDFISDARNLNSDLGRHVKKCSFSSSLSGRFYKNSSLENHMASKRKVAVMKEKKRQLEKALKMEDQKIKILEEKLKEKECKRKEEMELRLQMEQAAIRLQTLARQQFARERLEIMRIEAEIVKFVVLFCQAAFRGRKGRCQADELRRRMIQHRKEICASTRIQTAARRKIARKLLGKKRKCLALRREQAATRIQSIERGRLCRYNLTAEAELKKLRENAAVSIQSRLRGLLGRRMGREQRGKKRLTPDNDDASSCSSKKKDRIPLHERRYSTYSVGGEREESLGFQSAKVMRRNSISSSGCREERFNRPHDTGRRKSLVASEEKLEKSDTDQSQRNIHRIQDAPKQKKMNKIDKSLEQNKTSRAQEKVMIARQKAAARVAEKERKARIADMKKIETAIAASERKAELEAKRKELLRLEKKRNDARKQSMDADKAVAAQRENTFKNVGCKTRAVVTNGKQFPDQSADNSNVVLNEAEICEPAKKVTDAAFAPQATASKDKGESLLVPVFDTSFEDDFVEDEDDLS